MGSGSSKQKAAIAQQLQAAEERYNTALQKIVDRENELANKGKELGDLKSQASLSSSENSHLQRKIDELEARCSTLLQDRERETRKLQAELMQELNGQLRVAEALTQERNKARKEADLFREKNKTLILIHEEHVRILEQEFDAKCKMQDHAHAEQIRQIEEKNKSAKIKLEQERLELRNALDERTMQLQSAESENSRLQDSVQSLQQSRQAMTEDLNKFRASLSDEQIRHASVAEDLILTQRRLAESQQARDSFEKLRNEAVSKRSASHEAFQATKLILSETHESYRKLQEAHDKLETQLAAFQKDASLTNDKNAALQRAHEQPSRELSSLRSNGDSLDIDVPAMQKNLANLQRRDEEAQQSNAKVGEDVSAPRSDASASRAAHRKLQSQDESETTRLQMALASQQATQGNLENEQANRELDQLHQKSLNNGFANGHAFTKKEAQLNGHSEQLVLV